MTLTNPRSSQIDTSDIDSTEFASKTQVNSVSSNLDSFASYANSTFSTGGGGIATGNGVVFSDTFTTSNSSSNEFSLSASVTYGENLLVYLNGLLQHPDAYTVSANTLTLINTDPLPSGLKVSVRELSVAGGVANVTVANASTARSSNLANGALLFDYEGSNLYVYDGSVEGGYYLSLTQAVIPVPPGTQAQGSVSGYSAGGLTNPPIVNTIDKFPFAADSNASDVGDLTQARYWVAGQSSTTHGYSSGGITPPYVNTIDKFPFAADTNATDVGDITQSVDLVGGQTSETSGYTSGGRSFSNIIDKFPFSSDANATDVGNLTQGRQAVTGQSSSTHGYNSGGFAPPSSNVIDKFPFSSDGNATDVGDLTVARNDSGTSPNSIDYGYMVGGFSPTLDIIDKFPFATDANATDVGNLTQGRQDSAGQSSTDSGYSSGGFAPPLIVNVIDKFPFATDTNASDVGDLTQARRGPAGQQI